MRFPYLIALIFVAVIGVGYWYQSSASICPAPLPYRLGEVDESFNISRESAMEQVQAAEALWEERTGRDLFVYNDQADFAINFVFDERQALSDEEERERELLDSQKEQNEEVFATVTELEAEYEELAQGYEARVAAYESRLAAYNQEVNKYNDRGGAPAGVFEELEEERIALNRESEALSHTASELNRLANRLNELGERGNQLVDEYNRGVVDYNARFGFSREFTQGDYQGDKINIYEFSNTNELQAVLAHEFGHALGIEHVEGNNSVMYYLLEDTDAVPILSEYDLEAYELVCGTGKEWDHTLRRTIRSVLTIFK